MKFKSTTKMHATPDTSLLLVKSFAIIPGLKKKCSSWSNTCPCVSNGRTFVI